MQELKVLNGGCWGSSGSLGFEGSEVRGGLRLLLVGSGGLGFTGLGFRGLGFRVSGLRG